MLLAFAVHKRCHLQQISHYNLGNILYIATKTTSVSKIQKQLLPLPLPSKPNHINWNSNPTQSPSNPNSPSPPPPQFTSYGLHWRPNDLPNVRLPWTTTPKPFQPLQTLDLFLKHRLLQEQFPLHQSNSRRHQNRCRRRAHWLVAQAGDCLEFQCWVGQDWSEEMSAKGD